MAERVRGTTPSDKYEAIKDSDFVVTGEVLLRERFTVPPDEAESVKADGIPKVVAHRLTEDDFRKNSEDRTRVLRIRRRLESVKVGDLLDTVLDDLGMEHVPWTTYNPGPGNPIWMPVYRRDSVTIGFAATQDDNERYRFAGLIVSTEKLRFKANR